MELTCEQLGITPDDIADRVAKKIADTMLAKVGLDYNDETGAEIETERPTLFQEMVRKRVARKVEQAVDAVANKVLGADLETRLEALSFPQTNSYGEPKAAPMTLLEYIAKRIDTYLTEMVNYEGRADNGYGGKSQARVVWMIDKHLQYVISTNMEAALKNANAKIVDGIAATVKAQLGELAAKLKVEVRR